ncbi:MAG: NUDIX domain-containing protein, partial [Armatimonadetes bacterium]|nr:NUDIX domain-containing protein [Armatimonadota bacterium]
RFGVRRIDEGEWWEGMYEFPRCAAEHVGALQRLRGMGRKSALCSFQHTVTHHRITVDAKLVRAREMSDELLWVDAERLAELPMPAPQRKIAECALRALRRPSSAESPPASPKTRPPRGSRSRARVPAEGSGAS